MERGLGKEEDIKRREKKEIKDRKEREMDKE
jgi:hypothetical protein